MAKCPKVHAVFSKGGKRLKAFKLKSKAKAARKTGQTVRKVCK